MARPPLEVADLVRAAGDAFIERNRQWLRWKHIKVLLAIRRCRTATIGGHLDECTRCGHRAPISYDSCRDRHCPKCQIAARDRWIAPGQAQTRHAPTSLLSVFGFRNNSRKSNNTVQAPKTSSILGAALSAVHR